jgi:outer membrane protein assembly factor BamB
MKNVLWKIVFLAVLMSLALTGCSGAAMAATSWPGISVGTDQVFVAYGPEVYAVNSTTGAMNWKYPEKSSATISYYAAPGITEDGQVIVCDYKGKVTSLSAANGAQNWTYSTTDRIIADPLVVGKTIYIASADYYLYAINTSGVELWKFKTDNHLWSTPVYHDGTIYQSGMDKKLYALSPENGSVLWSTDLGGAALGTPAVDDNGIIYASTLGKEIVAVNPQTHATIWKYKTADSIWSGVATKNNVLYFGDLSGNLVALDTVTQKPVWQYKAGGAVVSVPLLLEDKIVFTSEDGILNGLDYNGKSVFSLTLGEKMYAPPVKSGDQILVGITGDKEKIFSAVNQTGGVVWSFQTPK